MKNELPEEVQTLITNFKERLSSGIAHFVFLKADGSLREAFGTTNSDLVPKHEDKLVERLVEQSRDFLVGFGTGTLIQGDDVKLNEAIKPFLPKEKRAYTPNESVITYYDLQSKGWRSFTEAKLKSVYYLNENF